MEPEEEMAAAREGRDRPEPSDETLSRALARADSLASRVRAVAREIGKVIVGQDRVVEEILITLLAGGHALLEGVPGLAKTLLVST
ncbi:MAG: hypothetical protein ACRD2T_13485, partial [Thermoanaerobaculia bacterium]